MCHLHFTFSGTIFILPLAIGKFSLRWETSLGEGTTLTLKLGILHLKNELVSNSDGSAEVWYYLPTPPLGQDMTQGQFLSGV